MVGVSDAPRGTVTLVFTDVVGSTALWDRAPAAMQKALDTHHGVVRRALSGNGGYEVECEGDGFFLAFADPRDGLRFCLDVQTGLHGSEWPADLLAQPEAAVSEGHQGLRVRVGMHVGVPDPRPDPLTGRMDYLGSPVNKAARLRDAAHGGQTLLSGPAWEMVAERMADSAMWEELGDFQLRGFAKPERLVQVLPPSLGDRQFPPVRALSALQSNIPEPADAFIGRADEFERLDDALAEGRRVITVLGPPGTGKTRLATEFARTRMAAWAREGGGTWFCDLSGASGLDGLLTAVGRSLGVDLAPGAPLEGSVEQIGHALAVKGPTALILDNAEQAVGATRQAVASWRESAPEAVFIVTSRERLGGAGESLHHLGPLGAEEGEALFRERAAAAGGSPAPGDSAIGEIVARLDGIPLAIELAAARTGVLSTKEILERLGERFAVLRGRGAKTDRHTTMRAAIDWSWDLLSPAERDALAQTSVFRGGFNLRAAEAVLEIGEGPDAPLVLDAVQSLRDKSLLDSGEASQFPGETRFRMLEGVREYAAERLAESGGGDAVRRLHAGHYLKWGERWASAVGARDGLNRLERLGTEADNLLAAFAHLLSSSPLEAGRAALALDVLYDLRGPGPTRVGLLEVAAEALADAGDPALESKLLRGLGVARARLGDMTGSRDDLGGAVAKARECSDGVLEAEALAALGALDWSTGTLDQAVAAAEGAGSDRSLAHALRARGVARRRAGDLEGAGEDLERAMAMARRSGDRAFEGVALESLGLLRWAQGRHSDSERHSRQALEVYREFGNRRSEGIALGAVGSALAGQGKWEEAVVIRRQATGVLAEVGDSKSLGQMRSELGEALTETGAHGEAEEELRRAIALLEAAGDERSVAIAAANLGLAKAAAGDVDGGRARLEEVLAERQEAGDVATAALVEEALKGLE